MEKNFKSLKILRFLAVPLGLIMFLCTQNAFGLITASTLGMIAMITFDIIVRKEMNRIISETLVKTIEDAIKQAADVQNIVEIQRLSGGLIARVYLVNAEEKTLIIHRAVKNSIDNCALKKYLWAMQLTNMSCLNSVNEARKVLNKQLFEELRQKKSDDKR